MISVMRLVPRVLLAHHRLGEGSIIDVSLGPHGDLPDQPGWLLNILYHHLQYLLRYPLCFEPLWMTVVTWTDIIKPLTEGHLFDYLRCIILLITSHPERILPALGLCGWGRNHPRETEFSVNFGLCELFFDLKLEIQELQLDALIDVPLTT